MKKLTTKQINDEINNDLSFKYKDLDDFESYLNDLKITQKKEKFRPFSHITPPKGLLNDPVGLLFNKKTKKYRIQYQWSPYNVGHGKKIWANLETKNFLDFEFKKPFINPKNQKNAKDKYKYISAFSGGGIYEQKKERYFWTKVNYSNIGKRTSSFIMNENNEKLFEVDNNKYTLNFRDPKPFVIDGKKFLLIGAQDKNKIGQFVLYESKDWKNFVCKGNIKFNKEFDKGSMIECPEIIKIKNKYILIGSAEGIESKRMKRQVKYTIGTFDFKNNIFKMEIDFMPLDLGNDYYAPQSISNKKDNIIFGWIGISGYIPWIDYYEGWTGALTLPRKIELKDNKLIQIPIINNFFEKDVIENYNEFINYQALKIKGNINNNFKLVIENDLNNKFKIEYKKNRLYFDFEKDELKQVNREVDENIYQRNYNIEVENLKNFFAIIEIFWNNGEFVSTDRFFIKNKRLRIFGIDKLTVNTLKKIKIKY